MSDFKSLSRNVKSQLFSTFCLDAYGSQLWPIHLYVDDHHGPHHEAVMVRELCIAIDENRFTVFTAEEMCHLVEYLCTIKINVIAFVHGVP